MIGTTMAAVRILSAYETETNQAEQAARDQCHDDFSDRVAEAAKGSITVRAHGRSMHARSRSRPGRSARHALPAPWRKMIAACPNYRG